MTDAITKLESWERTSSRLDRDWALAWRRADRKFTKCGIEPDLATRAAAVVLELWIKGAGPFAGEVTRGDLLNWLDELYTGSCGAKPASDGRLTAWERLNLK